MKTLLMFLLLLAGLASAQVESHAYYTASLLNTDTDTLFFLRQNNGYTFSSYKLPTKAQIYGSQWSTPVSIRWEGLESTGMADTESDSLKIYVMPITYDMEDGAYEIVSNVSLSVPFASGTQLPNLTKKVNTLNWTSTVPYYCTLLDSLGRNPFDGAAGIAVMLTQYNSTSGTGLVTVQPSFRP